MFLVGIYTGVKIVCTSLLIGKHDWSISSVAKCKIKSCLAHCAISVTLSLSSRGARSVTSSTFNMTSVSNAYPCAVPLSYLGAIYLPFEYLFFWKKRIFYSAHVRKQSLSHVR